MSLTKKQQARRRGGIGASEIAALAGLSKWSSPIAIWERKVGARVDDLDSYAADLGNELEEPIARVWAKRSGKFLARVDTLQHPTKALALATPDRAVYSDAATRGDARKLRTDVRDAEALLQVKSTNWRMRRLWGEPGTDSIPDEYLAQVHWEGAVAGARRVVVAVDFDKTELFEFPVSVDLGIFEALYDVAARFWRDHVETRTPPPPDASDAYAEFLARAFPREASPNLARIEPGTEPDVERAVAEFLMLRAADKRLKQRKDLAYQRIAARIGDAAGLEGAFGRIIFKRTRDTLAVKWQALAEDALASLRSLGVSDETLTATLLSKHTTTRPGYRTMRVQPAPHLEFTAPIELVLDAAPAALAAVNTEEEGTP